MAPLSLWNSRTRILISRTTKNPREPYRTVTRDRARMPARERVRESPGPMAGAGDGRGGGTGAPEDGCGRDGTDGGGGIYENSSRKRGLRAAGPRRGLEEGEGGREGTGETGRRALRGPGRPPAPSRRLSRAWDASRPEIGARGPSRMDLPPKMSPMTLAVAFSA